MLVVDHRSGLTADDARIAERLRREAKPVMIAVNKAEGVRGDIAAAEFHALGLGDAARHLGDAWAGRRRAVERARGARPSRPTRTRRNERDWSEGRRDRPAERRQVHADQPPARRGAPDHVDEPGTTRDSIYVPCERDEQKFVLIDTAGVRRRARVSEAIEKYSVVQSLQAIEDAGA